jgi:hypothetical protein
VLRLNEMSELKRGAGSPLQMKSEGFTFYTNDKSRGYPSIKNFELTLTPERAQGAAGVVFLNDEIAAPFVLTFEYRIWNPKDGRGNAWSTGDEMSVLIGVDESVYMASKPPSGSAMGYAPSAGGFGIFFKL